MERDNILLHFDFYKELLTNKQNEYIKMYYLEDYSLKEIADNFNVSRNAIFDNLKKTVLNLEKYETKLKLIEKYLKRNEIINQLKKEYSISLLEELENLE